MIEDTLDRQCNRDGGVPNALQSGVMSPWIGPIPPVVKTRPFLQAEHYRKHAC
jgi:hypothetical protein